MSLKFAIGSLFDRPHQIRVNTVNCVGIMGKGIALQFKQRYPIMFQEYVQLCKQGTIKPGYLHQWQAPDGSTILNFPTKRHWREDSRYEDIQVGLDSLRELLFKTPLTVGMPPLGCGNGGLAWAKVKPMITAALSDVPSLVTVYEPL